jgi:hypothetical protein
VIQGSAESLKRLTIRPQRELALHAIRPKECRALDIRRGQTASHLQPMHGTLRKPLVETACERARPHPVERHGVVARSPILTIVALP